VAQPSKEHKGEMRQLFELLAADNVDFVTQSQLETMVTVMHAQAGPGDRRGGGGDWVVGGGGERLSISLNQNLTAKINEVQEKAAAQAIASVTTQRLLDTVGVRNGRVSFDDFIKFLRCIAAEQEVTPTITKHHTKEHDNRQSSVLSLASLVEGRKKRGTVSRTTKSKSASAVGRATVRGALPPPPAGFGRGRPAGVKKAVSRVDSEQIIRNLIGAGMDTDTEPLTFALLHDTRQRLLTGIEKHIVQRGNKFRIHTSRQPSGSTFLQGKFTHKGTLAYGPNAFSRMMGIAKLDGASRRSP
jgi:hypothetical protein